MLLKRPYTQGAISCQRKSFADAIWLFREELNFRPTGYQPGALATELRNIKQAGSRLGTSN